MVGISFRNNESGTLVGVWPGTTEYIDGKPRKKGQIYLGKVINRERNIFWNRKQGYVAFDPKTQSFTQLTREDVPFGQDEPDGSRRRTPVLVDFGDSYFLSNYIEMTGYSRVINKISVVNRDTLYAMICYYVLEDRANSHAETWYRHNYASYLYPHANVYSQRISDLLATLGEPEQKRNFLLAHIEYVLSSTDRDVSVLIDSTGMPNKCGLSITRYSNHEGDVNIEFRMIALVQRSTGLPLFYEIIPGNVVDISTTTRIMQLAERYNCKVSYAIGDAGYCCPATMEKQILSGIDFMTRLNPTYDNFKNILVEHGRELDDSANLIRFKNRLVSVVKIETVIAKDANTGAEQKGFFYLCKDHQSNASKKDHLMSSKVSRTMKTEEIIEACERFGIFAIVSTKELSREDVLPEYYVRQDIEQYFDYGKNYARFLPVRQHNEKTLAGHMLLAFIATFIVVMIKNRLNILDSTYTEIPGILSEADAQSDGSAGYEIVTVSEDGVSKQYYIKQDPLASVFRESPSSLFYELRCQKAEVFKMDIIPEIPVRQAKDFYEAFRLHSPSLVRRDGDKLEPEFADGEQNRLTRKIAFARKPTVTDEDIERRRQKKAQTAESEKATTVSENQDNSSASEESTQTPKKKGRPKGSKNKATLLREAEEKANGGNSKPKRRPGRPKGSKNKKTLQREAEQAQKGVVKRRRGRPIGSKNKPKNTAGADGGNSAESNKK
ncbi:MAG: transposase [Succinivibrionaceae bacterium]|nr:transposase [Succinivibrionaceae bacterium]